MNQASASRLLESDQMQGVIDRLAKEIAEGFPISEGLLLLGIRTRGVVLAERLRESLRALQGREVGLGSLDITLYRDDLSTLGPQPLVRDSEIPVDVDGARIVLVDDVLFTGRTVRAALDEIVDYGRPKLIRLCVLVDRGLREYPIQADFVGLRVDSQPNELVRVMFEETDGEEGVKLETR